MKKKRAEVTYSRLHDHINIGNLGISDPIDNFLVDITNKIKMNLPINDNDFKSDKIEKPTNDEFTIWTKLVSDTIREVYGKKDINGQFTKRPPKNLQIRDSSRADGFPTPDDIGAAYGTFRLLLKIATEEKSMEIKMPKIDITPDIQNLMDDLQAVIDSVGTLPDSVINTSDSFNWSNAWESIKSLANRIGKIVEAVGEKVFELIRQAITDGVTVMTDTIKILLFYLNNSLFTLYNTFRDVLVYNGYALPHTKNLDLKTGFGLNTKDLWQSKGNLKYYPIEEMAEERKLLDSNYTPFIPPNMQSKTVELPSLSFVAPYSNGDKPDSFIINPIKDNMFDRSGPQTAIINTENLLGRGTFPDISKNIKDFGGAYHNCIMGIESLEADIDSTYLPDYNLDGDRTYASPCWGIFDEVPLHVNNPRTITPLVPESTVDGTSNVQALVKSKII